MIFDNAPVGLEGFLRDYWQQRPLMIPAALPDFEPALSADDIAGLACEPTAEARLVSGSMEHGEWRLRHGPFADRDFADLPERDWTLLVQDVEKHYPPLRSLMARFEFLPRWRIDDLMVSVAAPGGSVGPHADQYDVFLLQATGRRRWQIAGHFDPEPLADCDLNVLRTFSPEQEWILGPGDILYLPPGIAHHGVALEPCMTWSVGMRAPSAADLLQALGEWLATERREGERYRDPGLRPGLRAGEIDGSTISALQRLLRSSFGSPEDFRQFIGEFLSRFRIPMEPAPPDRRLGPEAIAAALRDGERLRHNPWTRMVWIEANGGAQLFAAGSVHRCPVETALRLCDPSRLAGIGPELPAAELELVTELVNQGHLYLERL
jgi:50S ribosomal protein L16 3-hydroxylase